MAAPLPRFGWWMTTRPAPPAAQWSSSSAVPSQEPSSTTTTCLSSGSASTRSRTSAIVLASLKTGTTKLTLRAGAGGAAGASRISSWRAALTPKWSAVSRKTGTPKRVGDARPSRGGRRLRAALNGDEVAATRTRAATAPERRSLLDLWPGPLVLVGALVAGFTIYLNAKNHNFGFDFRGGEWAAGRDVLHGRSPYPAPDAAHLVAVGNAYIPPPLLAVLSAALSLLPMVPAAIVLDVVSTAALALALRIVGVRDWRVYGLALTSFPCVSTIVLGQPDGLLALGVALAWRYRSSWRGAAAVGTVVALKLLAWPLLVWFVATRRLKQAAVAAGLAVVLAVAVAAIVVRLAGDRDLGVFTAALAFGLLASPILWTHYLVVLLVPLAITHRRADAAWLATIAYWLSPLEPPPHVWKGVFVLLLTATLSVVAADPARLRSA